MGKKIRIIFNLAMFSCIIFKALVLKTTAWSTFLTSKNNNGESTELLDNTLFLLDTQCDELAENMFNIFKCIRNKGCSKYLVLGLLLDLTSVAEFLRISTKAKDNVPKVCSLIYILSLILQCSVG